MKQSTLVAPQNGAPLRLGAPRYGVDAPPAPVDGGLARAPQAGVTSTGLVDLSVAGLGVFVLALLATADAFQYGFAGFRIRPFQAGVILLAPLVLYAIVRSRGRLLFPPLFWPLASFVVLNFALLRLFPNPFGIRSVGIVLSSIAFYYTIITLAGTRPRVHALIAGFLAAGAITSALGLAQFALAQAGRPISLFGTQEYHLVFDGRASSIFLEPDYFGIFASLPALFALTLALSPTQSRALRIVYVAVFLLNTAGMLVSGTRSAFVGFAVSLAVLAGIQVFQRGQLVRRLAWLTGIVLVALALGAALLASDLTIVQPIKQRFSILLSPTEGASAVRLQTTALSLLLASDQPLTGHGPGSGAQLRAPQTENGYLVADLEPLQLAPGFYTFHVYSTRGGEAYGAAPAVYSDLGFLKSSTGNGPVDQFDGTYKLRFVYDRVASDPTSRQTQEAYPKNPNRDRSTQPAEWKSSLVEIREPIVLRQIGAVGTAPGGRWELRRSGLRGGWGDVLAAGDLGTKLNDGHYSGDLAPLPLAPGFYTIHLLNQNGTFDFGDFAAQYPEITFAKSTTATTNVDRYDGTYKLRLVYEKTTPVGSVVRIQDAYPDPAATPRSRAGFEWKSSLFEVRRPIWLRQVGAEGTAPEDKWELRRSTSAGVWGNIVATGNLGTSVANRVLPRGPHTELQEYTGNLLSDTVLEYGLLGAAIITALLVAVFGGLIRASRRVSDTRLGYVQASLVTFIALVVATVFTQVFFFSFFWLVLGLAMAVARLAGVSVAVSPPVFRRGQ
ncbi:MAG: O-antigen ligase family protein [Chloroflexi bacterium]|nr:O-antigen ligase family protein [Chloroflexota bacterium]